MAVGSKDLTSKELRGLDEERLVEELRKAKEELFNLRFQSRGKGVKESRGTLPHGSILARRKPELKLR